MKDNTGQYTVHQFLNGKSIHMQTLDDPFHHTTTRVRLDLWDAVKALFGGLTFVTILRGSYAAHRVVFTGDYTPDPPRESVPMSHCGADAKEQKA